MGDSLLYRRLSDTPDLHVRLIILPAYLPCLS